MAKDNYTEEDAFKHLKQFNLTSAKIKNYGNIPTGHFSLDFAIQFGYDPSNVDLNAINGYDPSSALGIPLGKLVEFSGREGGGKSSLALRVCGYAQKLGYNCAWLDAENSFQESLAKINGCNFEDLIYTSGNSAEDTLDLIRSLCVADKVPQRKNDKDILVDSPKVIVLDSIASLVPHCVEITMADQQYMGLLARMLSQNIAKIATAAEKNGVLVIFINQVREKIGSFAGYGIVETTPGGRAIRHAYSLRLKISPKGGSDSWIYKKDEETGNDILLAKQSGIKIEKNKFAKPMLGEILAPVYFESYFPNIEDIAFDVGRQLKVISVRKGIYSWDDNKVEGREDFIKHIKEKGLLESLIKCLKEKALEENTLLPPELNQFEGSEDGEVDSNIPRTGKKKNSKGSKNEPE